MKKIKFLILFIFLVFLFPLNVSAYNKTDDKFGYNNNLIKENKLNLYFFYSDTCPHCHQESIFIEKLKTKYDFLVVYKYETNHHPENYKYYEEMKNLYEIDTNNVPLTVIGSNYYIGYNDTVRLNIENQIKSFQNNEEFVKEFDIPLIGQKSAKDISIPILAIILGTIDGFNPCAMWVLLFILGMLINIKERKKMLLIGSSFLLASWLMYFLSILGISLILNISTIKYIRYAIGFIAFIAGSYNIFDVIKTFNNDGCHVIDNKKRNKVFKSINNIISTKSFIIGIICVCALAISVNLVELTCSLGFPAIFSEILAINEVNSLQKTIYVFLYTLFYMIDDVIVFIIAYKSLKLVGISNKVFKYVKLIAALLIIIMGILLIFAPNIVMFNF